MGIEAPDPVDPFNEDLVEKIEAFKVARTELINAVEGAKQADLADGMAHLERTDEILGHSDRFELIQEAEHELAEYGLPFMPNTPLARLPHEDDQTT